MIESISISSIATYDENKAEKLENLKKINFIYGGNGSGKTTISLKIFTNHIMERLLPFILSNERPTKN